MVPEMNDDVVREMNGGPAGQQEPVALTALPSRILIQYKHVQIDAQGKTLTHFRWFYFLLFYKLVCIIILGDAAEMMARALSFICILAAVVSAVIVFGIQYMN